MENFRVYRDGNYSITDNAKIKIQTVIENSIVPALYRIDDYFVNH